MGEATKLWLNLFRPVRKLGSGGMGAVYEVVADQNALNYTAFLADMIAWREALLEDLVHDLPGSITGLSTEIRSLKSSIDGLVLQEMELQSKGASEDEIKEVVRKKKELVGAKGEKVENRKAERTSYVQNRKNELITYTHEQLIYLLKDYGVDLPPDLRFALKISHTKDEMPLKRLQAEWKSLIELVHPNIVDVFSGGNNYYVMEFIRGKKTPEDIANCKIGEEVGFIRDAARGLAYAHEFGIIHRDIKTDNIFVGENGITKLGDFGLAKTDHRYTQSGDIAGTPHFMPPEQFQSTKDCNELSDIYSLGATLYQIITRRLPFGENEDLSIYDLIQKIVEEPLIPPSHYAPKISEDLEEIILAMMEKDPSQRPQSAVEVADMCEAYLKVESAGTLSSKDWSKLKARRKRGMKIIKRRKIAVSTAPKREPIRARPRVRNGAAYRSSRRMESAEKPGINKGILGAIGAGILTAAAALYIAFSGGNGEEPPIRPPTPQVNNIVEPVEPKPNFAEQYRKFLPKVDNLETDIDRFLASGSIDLTRLNELDRQLKEYSPEVISFKKKGVREAIDEEKELADYKGKLNDRHSLVVEFNKFSKGVKSLEDQVDNYLRVQDKTLGKLTDYFNQSDVAKRKIEGYGRQGLVVNSLTQRLTSQMTRISDWQKFVETQKVEPKPDPKYDSELWEKYQTFAKQSLNLGPEITELIKAGKFEKAEKLSAKLKQDKTEAQRYKISGIKEATDLLTELDKYENQLSPVEKLLSNAGHRRLVLRVANLEGRINDCIEKTPEDKSKLKRLLRELDLSYIGSTYQLMGISEKTELEKVTEGLYNRAKRNQKTLDDTIKGVVVATGPKIPEGLIAMYTFDRNSLVQQGDRLIVKDMSGKGNHGEIRNNARLVNGLKNEAIGLDGVDDYIIYPNLNVFDGKHNYTVSLLFNRDEALNKEETLWGAYGESTTRLQFGGGGLGGSNSKLYFVVYDGSNKYVSSSEIPKKEWTHVVITYDVLNGLKMIINGQLQGVYKPTPIPNAKNASNTIGAKSNNQFSKCVVDDFMVFNRVLSDEEIKELYKK